MKLIGYFLGIALLLLSCGRPNARQQLEQDMYVDSVMISYRDSLISSPEITKSKLLQIRNSISDSINYYKLNVLIGFCYYHNFQDDSTRIMNRQILDFLSRHTTSDSRLAELKAFAYNYIGIMLQDANQRDSAIVLLTKAYRALENSNNRYKMPDICINLADNYYQVGNYVQSVSWYRQALRCADSLKIGDKLNHAIYCGLGHLYGDIGNNQLAEHYYSLAEKSYATLSPYEQYYFANTRGNYYYLTQQYKNALKWFYQANAICRNFNKPVYQAITESNLGEVYLLMGQIDSAQHYLNKAGSFFLNDNTDASTRFYFDGLYASLALCKNELGKAKELLTKPYDPSQISPNYIYLHDKRLEELYARMGDYAQAYSYQKKMHQYDDSLHNIKVLNNIAELDFRYRQDTLLLHRDVQLAQNKARTVKFQYLSLTLALALIIVLFATVILVLYARRKREQRYARQMATITCLRMENVRNRVSPHFIFNALNAFIPALRQYENLGQPLNLLIQSIRNNLLISDKVAISLEEEVSFVRNYLDLKKCISKEVPKVEWNIDDGVDRSTLIPSMMIQILVENAVKYAFQTEQEDSQNLLSITIRQTDVNLVVVVEDNGVGFVPGRYSDTGKGTGSGLKVLFRTVELLNKRNQRDIKFRIDSLVDLNPQLHGTRAVCEIPLNYNYEV